MMKWGNGMKKIYITTDLEGASGVYCFDQSRNRAMEARESLMNDLNACIKGLREGGADYILAVDGHGPGRSFIPEMMIEGAEYLVGKPRPRNLFGMDESFCGLVFLGYHAMMGTPDGVLNHTQNSKIEKRYWYDGVESGEMAQIAMIAGSFGVPVIMVTGDEATCREAINFFGP
jgi:D-amino peptidase